MIGKNGLIAGIGIGMVLGTAAHMLNTKKVMQPPNMRQIKRAANRVAHDVGHMASDIKNQWS